MVIFGGPQNFGKNPEKYILKKSYVQRTADGMGQHKYQAKQGQNGQLDQNIKLETFIAFVLS